MTELNSLEAAIARLRVTPRDEEAWRYLYRQLRPFILAVAFRRLKDREGAEEVAQEVLVRILRARPFDRIHEEGAFRAYVWKMTLNVVNTHLRKVIRAGEGSRRWFEWNAAAQAEVADPLAEEQNQMLLEEALGLALDELEPSDSKFVAMLLQGRSLGEIATALDISYSNAGVRYHRLKRKLRNLLIEKEKIN
jgi:RNA polymerase sigma-70 factor (ECF subfamily)